MEHLSTIIKEVAHRKRSQEDERDTHIQAVRLANACQASRILDGTRGKKMKIEERTYSLVGLYTFCKRIFRGVAASAEQCREKAEDSHKSSTRFCCTLTKPFSKSKCCRTARAKTKYSSIFLNKVMHLCLTNAGSRCLLRRHSTRPTLPSPRLRIIFVISKLWSCSRLCSQNSTHHKPH